MSDHNKPQLRPKTIKNVCMHLNLLYLNDGLNICKHHRANGQVPIFHKISSQLKIFSIFGKIMKNEK